MAVVEVKVGLPKGLARKTRIITGNWSKNNSVFPPIGALEGFRPPYPGNSLTLSSERSFYLDVITRRANEVVILGAGLAGLAAGHVLSRSGVDILVVERDATVGGLAKTVNHQGFRFDLGGHRFKTDSKKIERLVRRVLKDELLTVQRSSKILLRDKYFDYPLKPLNAFFGLGIPTATRIIFDYTVEQLRQRVRNTQIISLEDWVVRHFGRTLFNIYFKEYSEKIWGIDCRSICMEWVEQRIRGLSLATAVKKALSKSNDTEVRTLASEFLYPPLGIGQISEQLKEGIEERNSVLTNSRIVRINHAGNTIESVTVQNGEQVCMYGGSEFASSIPLATLVQLLHPKPPIDILDAASRLRYRDLVIVTILLNCERVTDQTWIYIPEQKVPFGRIHEPTNWSRKMAPEGKTLLVAEHFCFRGDDTWSASDEELAERTITSLERLGFIKSQEVIDKVILRIPKAYPLFEVGYQEHYRKICDYLSSYRNLHLLGRGGMFKYYNMDHAMESGIATAEGIIARNSGAHKEELEELALTGTDS